MKITTVIISHSPLKSVRTFEALRMSVGLTLCDDAVNVLLIGDGVYALLDTEPSLVGMPEYVRHIETLSELGHRIYAERESIEERGLARLQCRAETVSRSRAARLLLESDRIIRY